MIAVIDYGAGNLRNVCKALEHVGADILLTDQPSQIERADKVVLPGVGAFADCLQGLQKRDLLEPLMDFAHRGRPFLGICVGMQLLFEVGKEMGEWPGLGLIPGQIIKFKWAKSQPTPISVAGGIATPKTMSALSALNVAANIGTGASPASTMDAIDTISLPIPHIGWNQVEQHQPSHPILKDVQPGGYAYFVHSFHAEMTHAADVIATAHYGYDFPAVVAHNNVWGIQFHPEKSQDVGLQMLRNFMDI